MKDIFSSTPCLSPEEIQRYLNQTLSEQERRRVEHHLLDCPLCSDALEGFAKHHPAEEPLLPASLTLEALQNQGTLQASITASTAPSPRATRRRLPINRIAAAILLLLLPLAAYLYWQENEGEQLYQAFYESAEKDGFLAQRANLVVDYNDPTMKKGMEYFNLQAYRESLGYFEDILTKDKENNAALFFAGMSSIELAQYDQAINYLTISRMNHIEFYETATWYLILVHLKLNHREKAQQLLDDLINSKVTTYRDKALRLQAQLQSGR
ncbi:MAG: zf-HC2 domain-containing protein [Bacteroidota bacterium]